MTSRPRARDSRLLRESGAGSSGSLVALLAGLGLDLTLAAMLGAGAETDALFVALRIPLGIAVFFPPTAIQVLVPAITSWSETGNLEKTNARTSTALIATFTLATILTLLGVLFAPFLVRVLAPGLAASTHDLAAALARIAFLMIPPMAVSQILRAYRHAQRRHGLASGLQAALALTIVAVLLANPGSADVYLVAWAYLGGATIQLAVAWALASSRGFRFSWQPRPDEEVRLLGARSISPLGASGLQLGARVVEQMVASFLAPGSITILTYANRLISAVGGSLVFRPVVTAFLVPMSRSHAAKDETSVRTHLHHGLRILLLISMTLVVFVAIPGATFVTGLFSLGSLSQTQAMLLATCVAVYSMSLPTAGLQRMLLAVSFARLQTSPYFRNTLYGAVANVALLVGLMTVWTGPTAILLVPVAYSLAQVVNVWHGAHYVRRLLGRPVFDLSRMLGPTILLAATAVLMFGFQRALTSLVGGSSTSSIVVGASTAGIGLIILVVAARRFAGRVIEDLWVIEPLDQRLPDPTVS